MFSTIRPGYERTPRKMVREHIRKGDRVLEAGAGIGGVTSEMVDVADFVVACEPQEQAYQKLVENVPDAAALPVALGVRDLEEITLYREDEWWNTSFWSSDKTGKSGYLKETWRTYPCVDVNRMIRAFAIDVLVMDCEGYESVILGAVDLAPLRMVAVEIHPKKSRPAVLGAALKRLEVAGFEIVAEEGVHADPSLLYRIYEWRNKHD